MKIHAFFSSMLSRLKNSISLFKRKKVEEKERRSLETCPLLCLFLRLKPNSGKGGIPNFRKLVPIQRREGLKAAGGKAAHSLMDGKGYKGKTGDQGPIPNFYFRVSSLLRGSPCLPSLFFTCWPFCTNSNLGWPRFFFALAPRFKFV